MPGKCNASSFDDITPKWVHFWEQTHNNINIYKHSVVMMNHGGWLSHSFVSEFISVLIPSQRVRVKFLLGFFRRLLYTVEAQPE